MTNRESRERLITIVSQTIGIGDRTDRIADHLLTNGVIVLPCKVGDLVYVIRRKEKRNKGGYWNAICFTKKVMQKAIKDGTAYIDCKRATKTDFSLIGKTVFLTKEEAEAKLRERKEDEGK